MERLIKRFVPERYILDIAIDKNKRTIQGVVTATGEVKAKTVKFHAVDLVIDEVKIDGKEQEFKVKEGALTLSQVPVGKRSIEVKYHGSLNENMQGAYISTYENGDSGTEVIVATQFESHYAREAFPCIDEPEAKAVFELTITTSTKEDMVLSNMPAKKKRGSTVIFEPTPRMSTYLLAWVIGKFHGKSVVNKQGVKITTYAALNQDVDMVDYANEVAARSLEFYNDNFGVPYPLKKLDQVALPDFEAGAMENWGLVTYRESMLLADKRATFSTKKSVALTVAHELSHQWFGDLVTMKWWDDLWLNESFASVMEYFAVDKLYPEYSIWEGFFTGDVYTALLRDACLDVQAVHQEVDDPAEIATLFDPAIVYAKGARLILMLIRVMQWENFCSGMKKYFEKYAYSNADGDDLWEILQEWCGFNLKKIMGSLIKTPGYPVLHATANTDVVIHESRGLFTNGWGSDKKLDEEVKAKVKARVKAKDKDDFMHGDTERFLLDDNSRKDDDVISQWRYPEELMHRLRDLTGHFVLDFSKETIEKKLEHFDEIPFEEKLRILMDTSLLARKWYSSCSPLIPILWKFRNEGNAAVWSVISVVLGVLKQFFDPRSAEEEKFFRYVRELVRPKLDEVGLVTKKRDDDNTIKLRRILVGCALYAEDKDVIHGLAKQYKDDFTKIEPEMRADILNAKLYLEPRKIKKYLEVYEKTADPELKYELLFAGTTSKDVEVLQRMLMLVGDVDKVKPQDQLYLFVCLYRNPFSKKQVFSWLTQHWEEVREMMGDKSLDNYPRYIGNIARTRDELWEFNDFFEPMRTEPAMARAIEIGQREIVARLQMLIGNSQDVIRALDDLC